MNFLSNKYSIWYSSIIERAKARDITGYYERHHIVPVSLGGNDKLTNIVSLTAREHFICHRLLVKMTVGQARSKMALAIKMMMNFSKTHQGQRYSKLTARSYNVLKELFSKAVSEAKKGVPLSAQARANIKASRTSEVRAKISASQRGRVFPGDKVKLSESVSASMTSEHRARLSALAKQRPPITEETRAKMRAAKKPMTQETIDKLTNLNKTRILSEESRSKLSAANKGVKRKLTPEQIAKRTASQKAARDHKLSLNDCRFC